MLVMRFTLALAYLIVGHGFLVGSVAGFTEGCRMPKNLTKLHTILVSFDLVRGFNPHDLHGLTTFGVQTTAILAV